MIDCTMIETDMGTFHCPELCDDLCKEKITERVVFTLSDFYQKLNPTERALIAKYPKKMLKAYKLSREAKELCLNLFIGNLRNDASDACRHFVWAALLYKTFGNEFSRTVLSAHEQEVTQPPEEKNMDLKNNEVGLLAAKQLNQKKKLNKKEIIKLFKEGLEKNSFVILKKNVSNQFPIIQKTGLAKPSIQNLQDRVRTKDRKLKNKMSANKKPRKKGKK